MRPLRTVLAAGLLAFSVIGATAGGALADGNTAVYQIEISANGNGPGVGGGAWLWIELDDAGGVHTGDYTGSDCGHAPGASVVATRHAGPPNPTEALRVLESSAALDRAASSGSAAVHVTLLSKSATSPG